jgi:hypothetical protein
MVTSLVEASAASRREVETASKKPEATVRNNMDFFIGYLDLIIFRVKMD